MTLNHLPLPQSAVPRTAGTDDNSPTYSIIVPTYNEADNVEALLDRLKKSLSGTGKTEVIFVDDSPDLATAHAVERSIKKLGTDKFIIKLYYRMPNDRWGGLGGAVADGLKKVQSEKVIVMDGDLQHPPELVAQLLQTLEDNDCVVASRYVEGGSSGGLNGFWRHIVSSGSTFLAKILFPRALYKVSDPMTGFFALRTSSINTNILRPSGFKILLEILARHPRLKIGEVPLQFGDRNAGDSKASIRQGVDYLNHLLRLRISTLIDNFLHLPRAIRFGFIGGGVFVFGSTLLFILVEFFKWEPVPANGLQLIITFALNYILNKKLTWSDRSVSASSVMKFLISRGATTIFSFFLFAWLITISVTVGDAAISIHYLIANVITLAVAMTANYLISDKWVFRHNIPSPIKEVSQWRWRIGVMKFTVSLVLYILLLRTFLDGSYFWAALLATVSLILFAQASMEVWRMLYSYREPDAVDRMRYPASPYIKEKFCLIVPARHEEQVLGATLEGLDRQTHPNVTILSVVCHDDPATKEVAELAASHSERIEVIEYERPEGIKPSKPLQLNFALEWMEGRDFTVIGVFDAEDTVHPELLGRVDAAFQNDDIQIVQGGVQLMNFDHSWFALHNVLEYWKWFSSVMQFQSNHRFVPLGGNTVFIRYELLKQAGGWPQSLTEDCALGVLLSSRYQAKTATYYDAELATQEETPETLRGLFFQRVRWMQGFYHEWIKGVWYELPTRRQRLLALYVLASPTLQTLSALMIPIAFLAIVGFRAPVGMVLIMYLPLIPLMLQLVLNIVFLRDFGRAFNVRIRMKQYFSLLLTHFPYQVVLNAAAFWAMIRQIRGEHSWHKTTHSGVHRKKVAPDAAPVLAEEAV